MTFPAFGVITGVVSEDSAIKVGGRVACIDRDTLQIVDVVTTDAYGTYRFEFLDTAKKYLVLAMDDNTVNTTSGGASPPSARYVRIIVGAGGTDTNSKGFAEVELASTSGGADLTTTSTPTSAPTHSYSNTSNLAVDNNAGNGWFAAPTDCAPYLTIDLGSSQTIYEVRLQCYNGSGTTLSPRELVVQLSDDKVTWDTVYAYADPTAWTDGVKKTFVLGARPGSITYNADAKNAVAADYVTPVEGFRDWDQFYRAMVALAANNANLYFFDHARMRFASSVAANSSSAVDLITGSQGFPGSPLKFGIGRTAGALPGQYNPLTPTDHRIKLNGDWYQFDASTSHSHLMVVTLPNVDDAALIGTQVGFLSNAFISVYSAGLYASRRCVMARYAISGNSNNMVQVSYTPATPLPASFMLTVVCTAATKLELYVDGTLVATSTAINGSTGLGGGAEHIQAYLSAKSGDGKSQPAVWCATKLPFALTSSQISTLHSKRTTVPSIATRTFADTVKALRPMHYLKMDNADPTQVVDEMIGGASAKSTAGTLTAAGSGFTPGVGAVTFSGAWVRPATPIPLSTGSFGFAFMAFMRITAAPSAQAVMGGAYNSGGTFYGIGGWRLNTDRTISMVANNNNEVWFEDFAVALNTDYLIVAQMREMVDRGLVYELFANGVMVSSRELYVFGGAAWANQNVSSDTTRYVSFGAARTSGGGVANAFAGTMGHLAYFNKPLTADEIATLYAARTL